MDDLYFGLSKINNNVTSILEASDIKSDTTSKNIDKIFSDNLYKEQWIAFIKDGKTPEQKDKPEDSSNIDSSNNSVSDETLEDSNKIVASTDNLNNIEIK